MVQGTRHLDPPRTEFTVCFLNVKGGIVIKSHRAPTLPNANR